MLPRYSDYDRPPQRPPALDTDAPASSRIRVGALTGALVVLVGLMVVGVLLYRPPAEAQSSRIAAEPSPRYEDLLPTNVPPPPPACINDPVMYAAAVAGLVDDDPVVGVCLDGKYRAYSLRAMAGHPRNRVVNDRLADHPVSVAHCDRTGCTVIVRGDKGASRLNLAFGGWYQGQMYVRANGPFVYSLATLKPAVEGTRPFPFAQMVFESTTWDAWRKAHPDTDVYTPASRPRDP
jgi:Protein of unknown function (DUF3179)